MNENGLNIFRIRWQAIGLIALLYLPISHVVAAENQAGLVISGFSWNYIARLVLTLVAVLVCFFFFAWILRRSNLPVRAHDKNLSVVASVSIGAREPVMVVQAGEKQVLLGITPTQINSLTVLESPLKLSEQKDETSFRTAFEKLVKKSPIKS